MLFFGEKKDNLGNFFQLKKSFGEFFDIQKVIFFEGQIQRSPAKRTADEWQYCETQA